MPAASKIERHGLAERILALSATKTSREIAAIVETETGISISYITISRFIKDVRTERAEQTKAVVQEAVKATVPRDLELLDELIRKEQEWFNSNLKVSDKLQVAKELRQTIDTKLRYSGAAEQQQQTQLNVIFATADDE